MPLSGSTADRIRAARKAANVSRDGLAGAIGLSYKTIQNYETGNTSPDTSTLESIAKVVGVATSDLLPSNEESGGDGSPHPAETGGNVGREAKPEASDSKRVAKPATKATGALEDSPNAEESATYDDDGVSRKHSSIVAESEQRYDRGPLRRGDVRVYDIEAGAGPAVVALSAPPDRVIRVEPEDWRMLIGYVPRDPFTFRVRGDSMLPWLRDGGAAWCEPCEEFGPAGRYVLSLGDGLIVKRVDVRRRGRVNLISDNAGYKPIRLRHVEGDTYEDLDDGEVTELRVAGRVIYPTDDGQAVFGQLAEFARSLIR